MTAAALVRRRLALPVCGVAFFALGTGAPVASVVAAWEAMRAGAVALFRHATAPGTGDPPGMRLDDCATQRILDAAGCAQAARIGEAIRA